MQTPTEGIFCALWTPLDAQGEVIWPALEKHLEFVIASEVHGIMALGSTANFPFLSLAQRKEILELIVKRCAASKVSVMTNVSDISFRTVVELAEHAQSTGANAVAVLPPWYYGTEQRDMAEFFIQVVRRSKLPTALYNYPEMTGRKIELETVRHVASTVQIYGFKQSGADFNYHHELIKVAKERNFAVYTGADTRLPEAVKIGASGTISGLANAVPDVLSRLWKQVKQQQYESAEAEIMTQLGKFMAELPYTLNVKVALDARGFETGEFPNPLSAETQKKYDDLKERLVKFYASGL